MRAIPAYDKCRAAIDDIYELRIRAGAVNYLLLYFFHGRAVSVVAHGLTKEAAVPAASINQAIARKLAFIANPSVHTFRGEINDA